MKRILKNGLCWLIMAVMVLALLPDVAAADNWPRAIADESGCPDDTPTHSDGKHYYVLQSSTDATCTEGGSATYKCIYCGATKTLKSDPLGHDWGSYKTTKKATCTAEGSKTRECQRCGKKQTKTIEALGHDWDEGKVTLAATCTEDGVKTTTCKRCGAQETEAIPAIGHNWDEGKVTKEPTKTDQGEKTFTCKNDPTHTYTEPIPALGGDEPDPQPGSQAALMQFVTQTSPLKEAYPNDSEDPTKAEWVDIDWNAMNVGSESLYCLYYYQHNSSEPVAYFQAISNPGESHPFTGSLKMSTDKLMMVPDPPDSPYAGTIKGTFFVVGYDLNEYLQNGNLVELCRSNTNVFTWKIEKLGDEPVNSAYLTIEKTASEPADPNGFQLGEMISYEFKVVYNKGEVNPVFSDVRVFDDKALDGSPEFIKDGRGEYDSDLLFGLGGYPNFSSCIFGGFFEHRVTQEDVDKGYFENQLYMEYRDYETGEVFSTYSNTLVVPVIGTPELPALLKSVVNLPQNGEFYQANEEVKYAVYMVNNTNETFTDIDIFDGGVVVGHLDKLDPGETSDTMTYTCPIDPYDAEVAHYVYNTADAVGLTPDGILFGVTSNTVVVYADTETTEQQEQPVNTSLSIVKKEVSSPGKAGIYVEGDTISYMITVTNTGEKKIDSAVIYDILQKENFGWLTTIVDLLPGESRLVPFNYVVTYDDTIKGAVANYAIGTWTVEGVNYGPETSNDVISPTGIIGIVTEDEIKKPTPGQSACKVTIDSIGSSEAHYTVTHCSDHEKTAQLVRQLVSDTTDVAIWEKAMAEWSTAIDALYDDLYRRADGTAAVAVLVERMQFMQFFKTYTELLYATADKLKAAEYLCDFLELYCTELCCADHTASDALPDSLVHVLDKTSVGTDNDACAMLFSGDSYTELYGDTHAPIFRAVLLDLRAADENKRANAFETGAAMWKAEMHHYLGALYLTETDARNSILIACNALEAYANSRRDTFGYLYADRPETVSESVMKLYRLVALSLCVLTEAKPLRGVVPTLPTNANTPTNPLQPGTPGEPAEPTEPTEKASLPSWLMVVIIAGGAAFLAICAITAAVIIFAANGKKKRRTDA